MRRTILATVSALALAALPQAAAAQGLARTIASAPDGVLRFSFASRPDVCGDGEHNIRTGHHGHVSRHNDDDDDDWGANCPCMDGPVRVAITLRDHRAQRITVRVGGEWKSTASGKDLGMIGVRDAVDALLGIASDPVQPEGKDAIFPATLADSIEVWPRLLTLARDTRVSHETRKQAVFWVSQAAGDSATAGLADLAENETQDRDIRTQAVFAISQRPKDEGVPILIRIAKNNRDPEVRRSAIFWLGQSDDPRALTLFEDLLVKK